MTDRARLEAAAAAGLLSAEQVEPLANFLFAQAPQASIPGEEDLRFIRNFHDVFLAIGILLFALGMGVAIVTILSAMEGPVSDITGGSAVTFVYAGGLLSVAAGLMWLLGEFFARRRRLFLPAIAIVCSFSAFAALAVGFLLFGLTAHQLDAATGPDAEFPVLARTNLLLTAVAGAGSAALFYLRFRLPFSLGLAGTGAAFCVIMLALSINLETTLRYLPILQFVLGLLLFLAGVAFDARDPARDTRFSDNGFWLHFAAAPLILNGVFGLIRMALPSVSDPSPASAAGILFNGASSGVQAIAILIAVFVLGLLSLLINRRALIVSALLTTGIAIGVLLNAAGLGAGGLAAATLLTLGAFVLILGAGWHVARRAIVSRLNLDGVLGRIIPPETATP